jgi:hypothetical protein
MKAKTVAVLNCACDDCCHGSGGCVDYPDRKMPIGTIIDHPDSWRLVRMGVAVPADEECEQKAHMTEDQLKAAQYAAVRTARGIAPEDFEAYDRGDMIGYYGNGSPIPGPSATVSDGGIILDDYDDD